MIKKNEENFNCLIEIDFLLVNLCDIIATIEDCSWLKPDCCCALGYQLQE